MPPPSPLLNIGTMKPAHLKATLITSVCIPSLLPQNNETSIVQTMSPLSLLLQNNETSIVQTNPHYLCVSSVLSHLVYQVTTMEPLQSKCHKMPQILPQACKAKVRRSQTITTYASSTVQTVTNHLYISFIQTNK